MRVELRVEARRDLLDGAWFYERQREGLGASFTDRLFEDLERLEGEAGILGARYHAIILGYDAAPTSCDVMQASTRARLDAGAADLGSRIIKTGLGVTWFRRNTSSTKEERR